MALNENELLPGEVILLSKLANLWVRPSEYGLSEFAFAGLGGKEAVGGKAHLTNFRVLFAAHGSNRLTGAHSLFLPNIRALRRGWTEVTVATEAQQYQFVMWFNRRFHDAVEGQRQAFGREDLRRLQGLVRDNLGVVLRGLQADERAEAVNRLLLGVRQPLRALAERLRPLRPAERGSVLEVHSLLKQEPAAGRG